MSFFIADPAGDALLTRQHALNEGNMDLRYFPADVSPFISIGRFTDEDIRRHWDAVPMQRPFSVMVVGDPQLPADAEIILHLPLFQMHCPQLRHFHLPAADIRLLGPADLPAMLDLTARTRPGPFFARTPRMGAYYGLFVDDKLVSMAGERLKPPGHTEASAICTDPDYLGRGYGSAMTTVACAHILRNQCQPFLHVRQDNSRAIDVYKKLGFEIRADVYFAIFKKQY